MTDESRVDWRLHDFNSRLSSHGERIARLETMGPTIEKLQASVDDLVAVVNKGRGAIWLIGGLGAVVGVVGKWVWDHWHL
ncbi:MAG: hypothetical protein JSS29_15770 [Proteobacteria bacterium]|nr:hypothetical protein [Pseudomonadota bacterium]